MKKKQNPQIEKARKEGYETGFKKGVELGKKIGKEQGYMEAILKLASKFEGLEKVKGVGKKTIQLIVMHFGKEYFKHLDYEKCKKKLPEGD